ASHGTNFSLCSRKFHEMICGLSAQSLTQITFVRVLTHVESSDRVCSIQFVKNGSGIWRSSMILKRLFIPLGFAPLGLAGLLLTPTIEAQFGPETCRQGFVWREACGPNDHVCVPPATRSQAAQDNSQAAAR